MNWSDEKYVKFYPRPTVTTLLWSWQTVALWPWLLARVDGAGVLDFGRAKAAQAVAVVTRLPVEVVEVGLAELVADGTVELLEHALIIPNFVVAQDARKSEAQKKRDQRERHRDQTRAETSESTGSPVPRSPPVSPAVPLQPSPAQPSPAQKGSRRASASRPDVSIAPDPRHAPLVKALVEAAPGYTFAKRDAAAVTALLELADQGSHDKAQSPAIVVERWRRARSHQGYPVVRSIHELVSTWNHFATDAPGKASSAVDPATQRHTTRRIDLR